MEIGYARVSTQEQNLDLQLDAFKKAKINKVFTDKVSGTKTIKPELERLLEFIRPGDTLVVWRLDRLGRTTIQLIKFIEDLKEKNINIRSLTEPVDTGSSVGNLILQLFCVLAEHERNVLRERTNAGLSSARLRGRTGGRPPGLSAKYVKHRDSIVNDYNTGILSTNEIIIKYDIGSRGTLYRILKSADIKVTNFTKKFRNSKK